MKQYVISLRIFLALLLGSQLFAGDGVWHERKFYATMQSDLSKKAFPQLESIYKNECSSCHMAYQPALLPRRSWTKMMNTLADHFNVDATLEPREQRAVTIYLTSNAGDVKHSPKHISRITNGIADNKTPLRITQTPYFLKEHADISLRLVQQKEVRSFANCNACHTTTEKGIYSKRAIKIPNYGRWED